MGVVKQAKGVIRKVLPLRTSTFIWHYRKISKLLREQRQLSKQLANTQERQLVGMRRDLDEILHRIESLEVAIRENEAYAMKRHEETRRGIEGTRQAVSHVNEVVWKVHAAVGGVRAISIRTQATAESLSTKMDEYLDPNLYESALCQWYLRKTGRQLDLTNPQTFNEKIQWSKIYDHDPLRTQLADKLAVREWVAEKIGEEYLIPLIATYDDPREIDFDALPDRFVLKANHGCGYNAIVRDKSAENLNDLKYKAWTWMREDFAFKNGFEMHYRGIERKLFVEEYLENLDGDMPDYKFWCFDGRVHFIQYSSNRARGLLMTFFDRDWNSQGFAYDYPRHTEAIAKPAKLDKMIEIAEKLAAGFPHVRVDLYLLDDGSIKFGEMTFTPASGTRRWNPVEVDYQLGELYRLPNS